MTEWLRDLVGVHVSQGTVHNIVSAAAQQAKLVNAEVDLSKIRVGLNDEIFGVVQNWHFLGNTFELLLPAKTALDV